jgi:hypothetical protein
MTYARTSYPPRQRQHQHQAEAESLAGILLFGATLGLLVMVVGPYVVGALLDALTRAFNSIPAGR